MSEFNIYATNETAWCPGCGDFGILNAVKKALEALDKAPHEVLMVAGIGQAAKLPQYISANGLCGLHGRALPSATGAKLANTDLTVIVNSGDGDCFGEGGNHFIHAVRRNVDMTLMVHNNQIYGLTQGQGSPTSDRGLVTVTQPRGVVSRPLKGPALAIILGCGFVARGFSGDVNGLSEIIQRAADFKGFSFVEVLQPCISMNKVNTFAWYKSRFKDVKDLVPGYDPTDRRAALKQAETWGDVIPGGVLYQNAEGPPLEETIPSLTRGPLVKQPPRDLETVGSIFKEFM
jgi:2-oxoglutarate/2-oxoacid ferredoxin oxidoreductase subunit beta